MGKIINNQLNGGLGIVKPSIDAISGVVIPVPAAATGGTYTLGDVYRMKSLADAEAIGVNSAFDLTNEVNAYQTILEFFRASKRGTLFIMFVDNTVARATLLQTATITHALKLVNEAEGTINQLAIACNPAEVIADYNVELTAVIGAAEAFATFCKENARPLHIVIEGYGAPTLDCHTLNAPSVSVMIGQNDGFYSIDEWAELHTAIGTALGVISNAKVNECIGWVGKFNLLGGEFVKARIQGTLISEMTPSAIEALDDKGYLYFVVYTDYAGLYMNDSHTCTDETDDYSKIEMNRTWNKASRLIRSAELPYLNSPVDIDTTTGFIAPITIANLEAVGNKALKPMFSAGEISGPDPQGPTPPVQIDPEQDVLATSNIDINVSIVPTGTARTLTNNIGFKNPNF